MGYKLPHRDGNAWFGRGPNDKIFALTMSDHADNVFFHKTHWKEPMYAKVPNRNPDGSQKIGKMSGEPMFTKAQGVLLPKTPGSYVQVYENGYDVVDHNGKPVASSGNRTGNTLAVITVKKDHLRVAPYVKDIRRV